MSKLDPLMRRKTVKVAGSSGLQSSVWLQTSRCSLSTFAVTLDKLLPLNDAFLAVILSRCSNACKKIPPSPS